MSDTRDVMEAHWVEPGYTAPNREVYPWQWLWDSCFHAIVWAELGCGDRALSEIELALSTQGHLGFVPHMNYHLDPGYGEELWGRQGSSSITQPPMYGHAVAELIRRGITVGEDTVRRAMSGLRFLLEHRERSDDGLVMLCHPWESGADDSPRWDDKCPGGFELGRWRAHKSFLVDEIVYSSGGAPLVNPLFRVASAGFNALVAFNTFELASVLSSNDSHGFASEIAKATGIVDALDVRWNGETWADGGDNVGTSGAARTIDAMLPLLVSADELAVKAALSQLVDPNAYGARFGPSGVHRAEATFDSARYWRGPAWPQINYLLTVAARRNGATEVAEKLAGALRDGAAVSGLAEYWNPDTGEGLGAIPQSWAGLAALANPRVEGAG
ncbi:MAG: hypothetical protein V3V01_05205 [Acidimicrobiales bacterium]